MDRMYIHCLQWCYVFLQVVQVCLMDPSLSESVVPDGSSTSKHSSPNEYIFSEEGWGSECLGQESSKWDAFIGLLIIWDAQSIPWLGKG